MKKNKVELVKEFSLLAMCYIYNIYVNDVVRKTFLDRDGAKNHFERLKKNIGSIDKKEILETYEY
jgi:hypothetical protein